MGRVNDDGMSLPDVVGVVNTPLAYNHHLCVGEVVLSCSQMGVVHVFPGMVGVPCAPENSHGVDLLMGVETCTLGVDVLLVQGSNP